MSRVLLVDDHELIRYGLAGAFAAATGFEVVGQAGSVATALELARDLVPEVVVCDVSLPDGSGLDVVRRLRVERPQTALVVLTMHVGDEQLFAAMNAGASAFVGKDAPSSEVVSAARQALVAPRSFTCSGLGGAMLRRLQGGSPRLTDREQQVLELLGDGHGVNGIAGRLFISESTAKAHIKSIYAKLGAENRAHALVTAFRLGLLPDVRA